ncbi:orotate phosphoribosyltransferase [Deinococcus roseus]|uniref:Orotate phosphoribosyltransferase n=1 Tax=Deinococcus roseus TaxID=392414 RepID=A0ABQ2D5Z9_9DEIO|nr:phosphoribosyltransferase family protein [Deinococcus roseus]GGJ46311.1 orotate phosphoribosyltransferase [Deinococcus roseus]
MSNDTLRERISDACLLNGNFKLRSGAIATHYFDKYRLESDPVLLRDIATALLPLLPEHFDGFAGLELGGVPIATVLGQLTFKPVYFVRKERKTYGTCQQVEGGDTFGKKLVVIEDVITSGGQLLESAALMRQEGALLQHALCVVLRSPAGLKNVQAAGMELKFLIQDF